MWCSTLRALPVKATPCNHHAQAAFSSACVYVQTICLYQIIAILGYLDFLALLHRCAVQRCPHSPCHTLEKRLNRSHRARGCCPGQPRSKGNRRVHTSSRLDPSRHMHAYIRTRMRRTTNGTRHTAIQIRLSPLGSTKTCAEGTGMTRLP